MMKYYKNYLNNLARTPNEEYRELRQETINTDFDNTTLLTTIQEEDNFDFNFHNIEVWVGTISDSITNSEKDVDDYRNIYFKNCEHISDRGTYYYFDKNYWMTYERPNTLEIHSIAKVRRCNNMLQWIDENTGELIKYPCILDYTLSSPNAHVTKKVTTANSHVTVVVQGNEDTYKLKKNQRFIFNGEPYRFLAINNYMQKDYVTKEVHLLFLDCYLDMEQVDDNIKDNVANTDDYKYEVKIIEKSFEQSKGFKGQLHADVLLNGEKVNRTVTWETSDKDIVQINNNGEYELIGNDNEVATITARIEDSDIFDSIDISIKESLESKTDIVITPLIDELSLYDKVIITANLYIDGIKQLDKVNCSVSGLSDNHYTFIDNNDNTFSLTNNKQAKTPLLLTFESKGYQEEIQIKLTSLF